MSNYNEQFHYCFDPCKLTGIFNEEFWLLIFFFLFHLSHLFFERNGVPHLRMRFYVQGLRKRATVHLEMQEVSQLTAYYL